MLSSTLARISDRHTPRDAIIPVAQASRLWSLCVVITAIALALSPPRPTRADIDPNSGIDFVRIGSVGNAGWPGGPGSMNNNVGRGAVSYEYGIGRYEVTTAQWVEFFNAAFDRPASDRLPYINGPSYWGASSMMATTPGGLRWRVPAGNEWRAVGGISWRTAAMYCNWLHNNRSLDRSAFLSGAYDVSTFGQFGIGFLDQRTRSPGARYFIPSLDEWLKAAHFDPHRYGPNQPGWWNYNITSDSFPLAGRPGQITPLGPAQANYGNYDNAADLSLIPWAYANVTSPWGLFDTSGATAEWLEEVGYQQSGEAIVRATKGSWWFTGVGNADQAWGAESDWPGATSYELGFRIATSIPAPSTALALLPVVAARVRRNKRSIP